MLGIHLMPCLAVCEASLMIGADVTRILALCSKQPRLGHQAWQNGGESSHRAESTLQSTALR